MFGPAYPPSGKTMPKMKDPPTKCQKCGGRSFSGPRYRRKDLGSSTIVVFYECLEYTCTKCGYAFDVQTKDAKEKHETE